jgi:antitoxin VapB
MADTRIAKLFKNGASQAVRLPAEFRFDQDEVYIHRNAFGDVVLSIRPDSSNWDAFFLVVQGIDPADEFLRERPLNVVPKAEGVFDGVAG